jgi:hypothetical protein
VINALLRKPPMPVHDPKKDGNPFRWIVATAPVVREVRQMAHNNLRQHMREQDEQ